MTKPISPDELGAYQQKTFPPGVFEAFNELIASKWTGCSATVKQDDVISLITAKTGGYSRSHIFSQGWLNVEEAYRAQGWDVEYDKPAYNESYDASFTFKRKK